MGLVLLRLLTMLLCRPGALQPLVQGLQRHFAVRAQWAATVSKVSAQGDSLRRGTIESAFQNVCLVPPGRLACLRDASWCWPW
jgi:hypothetical protein